MRDLLLTLRCALFCAWTFWLTGATLAEEPALDPAAIQSCQATLVYSANMGHMVTGVLVHTKNQTSYFASTDSLSGPVFPAIGFKGLPKSVGGDPDASVIISQVENIGSPRPLLPPSRLIPKPGDTVFVLSYASVGGNPGSLTASRFFVETVAETKGLWGEASLTQAFPKNINGGAVLDEKGRLLGVAVANRDSKGRVVSMARIGELLKGSAAPLNFGTRIDGKGATFSVGVRLLDPFGAVHSAVLCWTSRAEVKTELIPDALGHWPRATPRMAEAVLPPKQLSQDVTLPLQIPRRDAEEHVLQVKIVRRTGETVYGHPEILRLSSDAKLVRTFWPPSQPPGAQAGGAVGGEKPKNGTAEPPADKVGWLEEQKEKPPAGVSPLDEVPKPVEGQGTPIHQRCIVPGIECDAATGVRLEVPGAPRLDVSLVRFGKAAVVPCVAWAPNGRSACVVNGDGDLIQLSLPDLNEMKRLTIGAKCAWLERSAEGLLVLVSGLQELWVLDEGTLVVKKRIPSGGCMRVLSASVLSTAFGIDARGENMTSFDLKQGTIVRTQLWRASRPKAWNGIKYPKDFARSPDSCKFAALTADGKFLLVCDNSVLARYRVKGVELELEEVARGPMMPDAPRISLSSDGQRLFFYQSHDSSLEVQGFRPVRLVPQKVYLPTMDLSGVYYGISELGLIRWKATDKVLPAYPILPLSSGATLLAGPHGEGLFYFVENMPYDACFWLHWMDDGDRKP